MKKITALLLVCTCALTFISRSFSMINSSNEMSDQKSAKKIHRKKTNGEIVQLLRENNQLLRDIMVQNHLLNDRLYHRIAENTHQDDKIKLHCIQEKANIDGQLLSLYKQNAVKLETVVLNSSSNEV